MVAIHVYTYVRDVRTYTYHGTYTYMYVPWYGATVRMYVHITLYVPWYLHVEVHAH
jgi:hypothetical protein